MAKKTKRRKAGAEADVESYKHKEAKRKNIPTAENQKLIADDDKAAKKLRWPRNPDLDPQLVWRGKDFESDPLEVDAPPIYIQEKIQPGAIIKDLQKQSKERAKADTAQFDFYGDFNGLPEGWKEDATQSYYHDEGNWSNRMILGDSLLVMASLAEREALRGKVQCVYMDPPYGIKFNSNWQPTTKSREVKDTGLQNVTREPEVIRAFRDTWKDGIHSYLAYLRDRLSVARDLLHESGSIFLQIGDENVHRVRAVMDEVFGADSYVNDIVFKKKSATYITETVFDHIVWYCRNRASLKTRELFEARSTPEQDEDNKFNTIVLEPMLFHNVSRAPDEEIERLLIGGGKWARVNYPIVSQHPSETRSKPYLFRGEEKTCGANKQWRFGLEHGMPRLEKSARLFDGGGSSLGGVVFWEDWNYVARSNIWADIHGEKFPKYVVQTAMPAIERCILMTTDPGDLVLDPTCGSGTTAYVAEQWGRRWITIDTSRVALTLARARLMGAKYDYYLLKDSRDGAAKEGEVTGKPLTNTSFTNSIRHGFVYDRVPHVTLKSIADNVEIDVIWERWQKTLEPLGEKLNRALKQNWEEWQIPRKPDAAWPAPAKETHAAWWEARGARQKEIDDSIARNAEVEYLFDRPYKARGVVRMAGPFTVESLSPHRVLPMEEDPYLEDVLAKKGEDVDGRVIGERSDAVLPTAMPGHDAGGMVTTDFAQVVYENLKTSGVQNTKKGERLMLENLRPFASKTGLIAFRGEFKEKGASKRAAVCIGPEYDTVGYDLVRRAAKEAVDMFDMLIVCGFAFAPEVDDTRLSFGDFTILKARMNQDLRMADKLKATGAGNLFVVFGEPDIVIHKLNDDMLKVEIRGMDIFDPTTGEVRSSTGSNLMNDVAAWFIDNDYDEESFFVRQAYFVGDDPYDGLKRALKADIDETAWAELNSTASRPFPRPKHGRICVKVINHFGDEVQKVFQV